MIYDQDLNRQVIKGDNCTISIPEIQLDIPHTTQRGDLNTIEGVLARVSEQLREEQPYRKETCFEVYEQVEAFCNKVDQMARGEDFPFTFIVDDASGNSFVENPYLPKVVSSFIHSLSLRIILHSLWGDFLFIA